jgi:hypothetical protein
MRSKRFPTSRDGFAPVMEAIDALVAIPAAGAPKYINNPLLAALRTWAVKGFDEFRVYYLTQSDLVAVIRILHDKRDIGWILERQAEDPSLH